MTYADWHARTLDALTACLATTPHTSHRAKDEGRS